MTGDDKKFSLLEKLLRIEDDDTIFDPNSEPSTEGCKASLDHPGRGQHIDLDGRVHHCGPTSTAKARGEDATLFFTTSLLFLGRRSA